MKSQFYKQLDRIPEPVSLYLQNKKRVKMGHGLKSEDGEEEESSLPDLLPNWNRLDEYTDEEETSEGEGGGIDKNSLESESALYNRREIIIKRITTK